MNLPKLSPVPTKEELEALSPDQLLAALASAEQEIGTAQRGAVRLAIRSGAILSFQKGKLPHGGWLPWLQLHREVVSERSAQRYLMLYEGYGNKPQDDWPESISAGLLALSPLAPKTTTTTGPNGRRGQKKPADLDEEALGEALADGKDSAALQFFSSPAWITEALLKALPLSGTCLEPCCGSGAISKVLIAHGLDTTSSDIFDRGYGSVKDLFKIKRRYDNVITNPPFNNTPKVIQHCLSLARRYVILLLPLELLGRKWTNQMVREGLRFVFPLSRRPKFTLPNGNSYTANHEICWLVWEKGYKGRAELDWLG